MFEFDSLQRIIKRNDDWYVETGSYTEGPFESPAEAKEFQFLQHRAEMARMELADLTE